MEPITSDYKSLLKLVNWNGNYSLSKASIGQIMVCFNRILSVQPKKLYEQILYENIKPEIIGLLNRYCDILVCDTQDEFDVKYHNLIKNLPRNVEIYPEMHKKVQLWKPRIGALIFALKQRVEFICKRDTPMIYLKNQQFMKQFTKMRFQLTDFLEYLRDFEQSFMIAIDQAHKGQQKLHS